MSEPEAREPKPDWQHLPERLRARIGEIIGEPVLRADIAWGGFGPSATFVLHTASGRKFFSKGTHPGHTEAGSTAFQREKEHYELFPELAQFGPRYHGAAEEEGWHMLVLDCAERAKSVPPWDRASFEDAIDLVARFHAATPTRAKDLLLRAEEDPTFDLIENDQGWSSLARDDAARTRFLALYGDGVSRWFDDHIARLISLEAAASEIGGARSWLHMDIRSDNLLFGPDRVVLVDWPFLVHGPSLVDIGFFLPSLAGEGGPSPSEGLAAYERRANVQFKKADILAAAAITAGFFAARAGEPDIPELPRLRWVQRLQLFPALDWTCELLGIASPGRQTS